MYETDLSAIYDAIYHFKNYAEESEYLVHAIRKRVPEARTLLEVGCGTGLYLEHLKRDFDVQGLDLSAEMLTAAQNRLPGIQLHEADMADFELDNRFDIVCCLFRSIAYVKSAARFGKTVETMARHVAPGGLVIIEPFFTPETYWVDRVTLNEYENDDMKIAWMYVSEKEDRVAKLDIHYLVGTRDGVHHFTELHEMGLFSEEDYSEAFDRAGLTLEFEPDSPGGTGMYFGEKRGS